MNNEKNNQNDADQMEAIEFVQKLALSYRLHLERTEGDFILNLPQFAKFKESVKILEKITKDTNGVIEIKMIPKELHGGIIVEVPILDVYGNDMKKLEKLMSNINVIGIEPTIDDSIIICCSINDLWEKVE